MHIDDNPWTGWSGVAKGLRFLRMQELVKAGETVDA